MKTVNFTDFRKKASGYITEVEEGEQLILIRHGKPVAEIRPYKDTSTDTPSWKKPFSAIEMAGRELSSAILDERNGGL